MKPTISCIDLDINQDNIEIVLQTSEGEKHFMLSLNSKGCTICSSDIGGMNEHEAGIFVTVTNCKTEKL